jgi:hypothetical protein
MRSSHLAVLAHFNLLSDRSYRHKDERVQNSRYCVDTADDGADASQECSK